MRFSKSASFTVAAAVVGGIWLLAGAPSTTAAYTDRTRAITSPSGASALTTVTATYLPTNTYLANTATAIQDGTLWVWGFRGNGLSGTGVASVAANAVPSAVVLPQSGYAGSHRRSVVKVAGTSLDNYFESDINYTGLAALSDDGIVYTWGGNQTFNMMGRTTAAAPYSSPGAVDIPGTVVDLISSSGVFMALTQTGDLYTWGNPQGVGATGQGTLTAASATPVRILTGVHSIGSGVWNGWAIRGNNVDGDLQKGVLWWGAANPSSTLAGNPSGDNGAASVGQPKKSITLSALATNGCDTVGVVAGSAADTCTIKLLTGHYFGSQLLTSDGRIATWGNRNEFGSGRTTGTPASHNTPAFLTLPNGNPTVVDIANTEDYVLILTSTGRVDVFGRYSYATGPAPDTGLPSTTNYAAPVTLTALGSSITHIGGFGYSGQARRSDGTYLLWGGQAQGTAGNTYSSVRNGWAPTTTPTTANQGLTTFVQPGK